MEFGKVEHSLLNEFLAVILGVDLAMTLFQKKKIKTILTSIVVYSIIVSLSPKNE
jgi:hypothetical protein